VILQQTRAQVGCGLLRPERRRFCKRHRCYRCSTPAPDDTYRKSVAVEATASGCWSCLSRRCSGDATLTRAAGGARKRRGRPARSRATSRRPAAAARGPVRGPCARPRPAPAGSRCRGASRPAIWRSKWPTDRRPMGTSALPGAFPSRAVPIRPCTGAGPGPSCSTPGSAPPARPTSVSRRSWPPGRLVSPPPSTFPPRWGSTRTPRRRQARSARWGWRSTAWPTCGLFSTGCRSGR